MRVIHGVSASPAVVQSVSTVRLGMLTQVGVPESHRYCAVCKMLHHKQWHQPEWRREQIALWLNGDVLTRVTAERNLMRWKVTP